MQLQGPILPNSSHAAPPLTAGSLLPCPPPPPTTSLLRHSFRRSITSPTCTKDPPPMKSWPSGKPSSALPCFTSTRNPLVSTITNLITRNFSFTLFPFIYLLYILHVLLICIIAKIYHHGVFLFLFSFVFHLFSFL